MERQGSLFQVTSYKSVRKKVGKENARGYCCYIH